MDCCDDIENLNPRRRGFLVLFLFRFRGRSRTMDWNHVSFQNDPTKERTVFIPSSVSKYWVIRTSLAPVSFLTQIKARSNSTDRGRSNAPRKTFWVEGTATLCAIQCLTPECAEHCTLGCSDWTPYRKGVCAPSALLGTLYATRRAHTRGVAQVPLQRDVRYPYWRRRRFER